MKKQDLKYMKRELKKSLKRNYDSKENPVGSLFLITLLLTSLGLIIYGGFEKSWHSIVSGFILFMIFLIGVK